MARDKDKGLGKGKQPGLEPRQCPICGETFVPLRDHAVYDKTACRLTAARRRAKQEGKR